MKLSGAAAEGFFRRPDENLFGVLLHGPEAGLTAIRRRELAALISDNDPMRITDLDPGVVGKEPAELDTALRARGFFPGRRAVIIDGAKESLAPVVSDIIDDLTADDALLVVTAGPLNTRSALRRLFEGHERLAAIGLYLGAISPAQIAERLQALGCTAIFSRECLSDLALILSGTDPGVCYQTIEKISLSFLDRSDEVTLEEVIAQLPADREAALDTLIDHVLDGRPEEIGPTMRRLQTGGPGTAQILIILSRRFNDLLVLCQSEDGIDAAINRLRPPVFGPKRQRLGQQARQWSNRVEEACRTLVDLERTIRSTGLRPDAAMIERCLLRLAMQGARQR
ncbi:MAG: hypothetical protein AAF526_01975 [Pseudomonadota bacterium]